MATAAQLLTAPKIDCHCHVLDPRSFPYAADTAYRPQGQEIGTADYFSEVMSFYGVQHALLVGPNSGYGLDNRCLLDAIARSKRDGVARFKGIAVVPNDCSLERLQELQAGGVIGVAFNPSLHGQAYYTQGTHAINSLLARIESLGMWAQFQVQDDQLLAFLPMIERSKVKVLIDHCGRPNVKSGLGQAGFQALLALGKSGQAVIKLSGYAKFSAQAFPFADTTDYVQALGGAFGLGRSVWASDWPYLKAGERLDYGPMMSLLAKQFSEHEWQQIMWDSPRALFAW